MKNIAEGYNMAAGAVIAVFSTAFGEHWVLFAGFFLFNLADWVTGWAKSRQLGKESSAAGLMGVMKKLWYWILVMLAFGVPVVMLEFGRVIGVDLSFLQFVGWFVLASLTVNEVRSILENLVEMGVQVPQILVKGLAVAQKLIEAEESAGKGE